MRGRTIQEISGLTHGRGGEKERDDNNPEVVSPNDVASIYLDRRAFVIGSILDVKVAD